MDYYVNEGNKLGFTDTSFDKSLNLITTKFVAGAALTKGQLVEISSYLEGVITVNPASAKSEKVIGVAMFDYEAGAEVAVECEGLFKLVASGAITAGSHVAADANGKVATATSGDPTVGIILNTTAVDGDIAYVKFSI